MIAKLSRRKTIMKRGVFIAGAVGLLLLASCRNGNGTHEAADGDLQIHEESEAGSDHGGEIELSPSQARSAGVRTERLERGAFHGVVATGGRLLEAAGEEQAVVAGSPGVVSFACPMAEGMPLAAGATLFYLSGRHVQNGDPVEQARIAYETAKKEFERSRELVKDQIVSKQEFEAARANYEAARLAYEAFPQSEERGIPVKTLVGGYVKACLVKEGDYVTVGQPLASIIRSRRMRLQADVPERYYARLGEISSATFRTSYSDTVYDLRELNGRLLAYGKSQSGAAPYIPVTFEFDPPEGLVPGAYAEVRLLARERAEVLSLPVEAITEEQGVHFVYVQEDSLHYRKCAVELGDSDGRRIEIRGGLHEGEQVVVQGAIHVKLASASNVIPAHNHEH